MLRRVLLRPARCALLSTAVNAESPSFEYLALDNGRLLPHPAVTRRVLEYLCVNPKDLQRALSDDDESRPQSLPYKALFAPNTVHLLTPLSRAKVEELDEEDEEVEGDEEDGDDEPAAVLKEQGRRQGSLNRNSSAIILAENKEWEWVPLHLALGIVLEFCFRGRFAEATKAYTSLPLTDVMRRKVVQVLEEFEQYPSVLYLYEVHRSLGGAVQPLDVASELNALKKMGRVDEMDIRFQDLPTKEQSRADIQQLMGN
ncbi:hypothetical protein BBO99_00003704 [Phytophthora kernoviae]|uniref:Uncharacterized protein n=2 Tax=Phytophthora kernoviae TaxID=325452 RepID=A0A421GTE9_9STRA|nr:hypothetical protein G195_005232 [Phytophthora kernoviae 00238/432]KAG2523879.1 hypothetical protein JM16_003209 [Phytophthora kernoviae]KAG2525691.1 hypothetical protein JM18_003079 [Phytophthora kernoviae]RLN02575.1 hypothetical protein BBI17_003428 [Phytophthora kernoviae]RLN81451.1 hypothetical protein BBO99_00003704 [Phytophthora kernoviae]